MTILTVIYPQHSGTFFDHDYYLHKHVPMVKTVFTPMGLRSFRLLRGTELPAGGTPIYEMTALLTFESAADCRKALEQYGKQIFDDIPNFTDMKPAAQMNDPIEC